VHEDGITYVGHATTLIELDGTRVLTGPHATRTATDRAPRERLALSSSH
jgi:L-ascorbate metabolism protein UlaG (beta-lactamase superfamily)